MRNLFKKLRKSQLGQGMTEYIIIVALIAIAAIGVITLFGDNIRALFAGASDSLAGQQNVTPETKTSGSHHKGTKSLKSFGQKNVGK